MSLIRIAMAGGALLVAGTLFGCGGGSESNTGTAPPAAENRPDAGLEVSKSIMQMQPPGPAGKKGAKN